MMVIIIKVYYFDILIPVFPQGASLIRLKFSHVSGTLFSPQARNLIVIADPELFLPLASPSGLSLQLDPCQSLPSP